MTDSQAQHCHKQAASLLSTPGAASGLFTGDSPAQVWHFFRKEAAYLSCIFNQCVCLIVSGSGGGHLFLTPPPPFLFLLRLPLFPLLLLFLVCFVVTVIHWFIHPLMSSFIYNTSGALRVSPVSCSRGWLQSWVVISPRWTLQPVIPSTHTHTRTHTHAHTHTKAPAHIHLCTHLNLNYHCEHGFSLFFSCTIAAVVEVLRPVTAIHHEQPVGSLHESDSLILGLNYCLNEQETRTRTVTAPPSFTRSLSVSHPSPSLFHSHSSSVSITPGCLFFFLKKPLGFPFCLQLSTVYCDCASGIKTGIE